MSILYDSVGLPAPVLRGILHVANAYDAGDCDYSVSDLLKPPQVRVLASRHGEDIVLDAADLMYQTIGSNVHAMLAHAGVTDGTGPPVNCLRQHPRGGLTTGRGRVRWTGDPYALSLDGWILEKRLFATLNGARLSGCPDAYDTNTGTIWDWKTTSVWSYVFGKDEWGQQLAAYDWLGTQNGRPPAKARKILGIWRDWSKNRTASADYPAKQVSIVDYSAPALDVYEPWLKARVRLHQQADQAADLGDPLPECSLKDRWKNNQRCTSYCAGMPWCVQAQALGITPKTTEGA